MHKNTFSGIIDLDNAKTSRSPLSGVTRLKITQEKCSMNSATKKCGTCNQLKSLDDFYIHKPSGKHEKRCKACKKKRNKELKQHPTNKSGVPHENEIIKKLRGMGIYACSGKRSRSRWVDVVAFGCVAIECKLAREIINPAGNRSLNWMFTKKQRNEGIRGDIILFMVNTEDGFDCHLFRANSPYLYRTKPNGNKELINPAITYSNHSHRGKPGRPRELIKEWHKSFEDARNDFSLILKVLNEKIEAMKQGKAVDKFASY